MIKPVASVDMEAAEFQPKRGRPDSVQTAAIDRNILDVARRLFLTNGYANTSMEAIAVEARASKATLYARYADKAKMFNAVVSERLDVWGKAAPSDLWNETRPISDTLFLFGVAFLRGLSDADAYAFRRIIKAEADRFPELSERLREEGLKPATDRLAGVIAASHRLQGLPINDAVSVAQAFIAALVGWIEGRDIKDVTEDLSALFVSRLVTIFLGGRVNW